MNTRQTLLVVLAVLLIGGLAVWWYFGFSLGFMRFFAAEPGVTDVNGGGPYPAPAGCKWQQVQCIKAPCPLQLICPAGTCLPRPACLGATPSCDIAEPENGWCPSSPGGIVSCAPNTQTVSVGTQATVTAVGGTGTYTWFSPEGSPTGGASSSGTVGFSVSYDAPGIKKVTVQSPRGDGSSTVDSVACTVIVQ